MNIMPPEVIPNNLSTLHVYLSVRI